MNTANRPPSPGGCGAPELLDHSDPEILDHTDLDHEGEGQLVGICRFLVYFPSQVTLDASRGDVAPSELFNNTIYEYRGGEDHLSTNFNERPRVAGTASRDDSDLRAFKQGSFGCTVQCFNALAQRIVLDEDRLFWSLDPRVLGLPPGWHCTGKVPGTGPRGQSVRNTFDVEWLKVAKRALAHRGFPEDRFTVEQLLGGRRNAPFGLMASHISSSALHVQPSDLVQRGLAEGAMGFVLSSPLIPSVGHVVAALWCTRTSQYFVLDPGGGSGAAALLPLLEYPSRVAAPDTGSCVLRHLLGRSFSLPSWRCFEGNGDLEHLGVCVVDVCVVDAQRGRKGHRGSFDTS